LKKSSKKLSFPPVFERPKSGHSKAGENESFFAAHAEALFFKKALLSFCRLGLYWPCLAA
jgi:hypothetical protein